MVRVNHWTTVALTAVFLLLGLLITGTRFVQAEVAADKQEIIGRVLNDTDKPLASADVGLQVLQSPTPDEFPASRFVAVTKTDSSGNFRLSVPKGIDNNLTGILWAIADGYQPARPNSQGSLKDLAVNIATVRLTPSTGTIMRIVNAKDEPVSGVRVVVGSQMLRKAVDFPIPPDWLDRVAGITDADGRVQIANAISNAITNVTLQPPGQTTSIRLNRNYFLNHHSATSSPHFTWVLPAKGNIEGHLDVQGGKLPAGLKITIQTESCLPNGHKAGTSGLTTVAVNAEGRFNVTDIAEGPVMVSPFLDDRQPLRAEIPMEIAVQPGKTTILSIPIRRGVLVRGLIRKQDTKQGYPHFSLSLIYGQSAREHRDMREKYELKTDENGRFSATIPPGPIELRLNSAPEDYLNVECWKDNPGLWGSQFEVPVGKESFDLEPIELVPADSISGKLVDLNHQPLRGREWTVCGFPDISGKDYHGVLNSFAGTPTDKEGRFSGSYPRTYPPVHWTVSHRRWPTPYQFVDDTLDAKVISRNPLIMQVPFPVQKDGKK